MTQTQTHPQLFPNGIDTPPGLPVDESWVHVASGGRTIEWLPLKPMKQFTNAFVWSPSERKILLGFKKRGFGYQMYNGFGGKIEQGETPLDAAKRELQEESQIDAPLEHCGLLLFHDPSASYMHLIHIFRATSWTGVPAETEEMRPEWFSLGEGDDPLSPSPHHSIHPPIPLQKMWEDDRFWLPLLLDNKVFVGRADFTGCDTDGSGGSMMKYWFGIQEV